MARKEKRISKTTSVFMIIVALIVDGSQILTGALIFVPTIIGVVATLGFFLWFYMYGISFSNPKKLIRLGASTFIELLPIVDSLPAYTYNVFKIISENKKNTETEQPKNT